jgi:hypothetical protein
MPLITPPGSYKFYDRNHTHTGNVQVNADGTWHWRGDAGTINSGKWGDVGELTHFVNAQKHVVAKRNRLAETLHDPDGPWMGINVSAAGSMEGD